MSKIIGVTVGTPTSPKKIEEELKPVKTVNGAAPDAHGNVEVSVPGGSSSVYVLAEGEDISNAPADAVLVIDPSGTIAVGGEPLPDAKEVSF